MKWLALVGVVALVVVALFFFVDPSGEPDRPDAPDPDPKAKLVVEPTNELIPPDPVADSGPGSIEVVLMRDGKPAAARVEVRPLDLSARFVPPFNTVPPVAVADVGDTGKHTISYLPLGSFEVTARAADGVRARGRAFCRPRKPSGRVRLTLVGGDAGLAGQAVHANGSPFRGFVYVSKGMNYLGQEKTGEDGRFVLTSLPAGSVSLTFLVVEGFSSTFGDVTVPKSTEEIFVVDDGLTELTGRVIADNDEEPVAGAMVRASGSTPLKGPGRGPFAQADRSIVTAATTDEKGRFRFRLPDRKAFFWVEADGFEVTQTGWAGEGEAVIRLKRQGHLSGRVIRKSDGTPVAGAYVRAWNWHTFKTKADFGVTDAEGRFNGPAGPGKGMLYVLGGGWVSAGVPEVTGIGYNPLYVELGQGETKEIVIEVVPSIEARGVVRNADGTPAPGVTVLVNSRGETRGILGQDHLTKTDESGRFAFEDLVPGYPYRFRAGVVGKPEVLTEPQTAGPGEDLEVTITLPEVRWLPVRFLDKETGEPIEGVRVSARLASGQYVAETATGADGRMKLGPIGPGDLRLYYRHDDYASPVRTPMGGFTPLSDSGPDPEEITFEIARVYAVSGRIVAVAGTEFAGGMLSVHPADEEYGRLGISGARPVAPGGKFRMTGLRKGTWDLVLREDTREGSPLLGRWTVDVPSEGLELALDPAFATGQPPPLTISVFGPDNLPLKSGGVALWVGGADWSRFSFLQNGKTTTDPVPKGARLWIEILNAVGSDGKPVGGVYHGPVVASGEEIVIHLPAGRSVRGKVVGPDGKPVAGVLIEPLAVPPAEIAGRSIRDFYVPRHRTDEEGAFVIEGLGNQKYHLRLDVPVGYALVPPVVAEPGTDDLVIRLEAGMESEVGIVDAAGKPVAGATLKLTVTGAARSTKTGADGRAKLTGIAPNRAYILVIDAPAGRNDLVSIRLEAWRPDGKDIGLPPGMKITGTVRGKAAPSPRAAVWWKDSRCEWRKVRADHNGDFEVVALADSPVTLCAAPIAEFRRENAGPVVTVKAGTKGVKLSNAAHR